MSPIFKLSIKVILLKNMLILYRQMGIFARNGGKTADFFTPAGKIFLFFSKPMQEMQERPNKKYYKNKCVLVLNVLRFRFGGTCEASNEKEQKMAEFEINCPHCGEELTVQKEWVGKEGKCPSCKKTFTISLKHRKFPRPGKKSSGNCNMSEDDDSEDDGSGWSEWIYPILVVLFFSMLFIFVECHAKKAPQARETSHESIMNDEEIARRKKQEHEYKKALKRIENISGGFESTD